MRHLAEFRVVLSIAALVSGVLLNGLTAYVAMRFAQRNAPLLYTEYKRVVWVAAGLFTVVPASLAAYWTYLGMVDPSHLPDRTAIAASVLALGTPLALAWVDRRYFRRREVAAEHEEEREQAGGRGARRPGGS
ncbi:MAG TPA: hypothetical protein VF134_06330 [Candidatus Dormibacteraeota bacterium]